MPESFILLLLHLGDAAARALAEPPQSELTLDAPAKQSVFGMGDDETARLSAPSVRFARLGLGTSEVMHKEPTTDWT